jgi:ParB/RepB/Spo0J family partition protein
MTMTTETTAEMARATDTFALINPYEIVADPRNVREDITDVDDLAASIFQLGLQQPLRVRQVVLGDEFGISAGSTAFMLIAGHRRFTAIRQLIEREMFTGDIPCMIAPADITDDDVTAAMIVENLQRADLNPIEEARAFERLTKEYRYKRAELAAKIARSESYIGDRLSLLKLPESIQNSVSVGHYPMTHALLLKGVPAAVIETITKGGRIVVTEAHTISRAVKDHEYRQLKDTLTAAATKSGIELFVGDRYSFRNSSDVIATFSTLDDAKLLAKYEGAPKNARLVTDDNPYSHSFTFELRKPLTAKQIEAREAAKVDARTAEQKAREEARAAVFAAEQATWTPEYRAWVEECDQLQAEHIAAVTAYETALDQARVAWSESVDAKKIARFAMLSVLNSAGWYELRPICDLLGINRDNAAEDTIIQAYVEGDARRLVQVVGLLLALPMHGDAESEPAGEDLDAYLAALNLVEPDDPQLPPEPTTTTATEATDDPIHDVA